MCTQNKIFIYKFSRFFNSRATYNIMLRENSENSESASEMKTNLLRAVSKIVTDLKQLYLRRSGLLLAAPTFEEAWCQMKLRNWILVSQFSQSCFWRAARSGVNARPLSSCSRRCFAPHATVQKKATSAFPSTRLFFRFPSPPPTDSCLSINVTRSKKNLFTLIFALIQTWLLLMLICCFLIECRWCQSFAIRGWEGGRRNRLCGMIFRFQVSCVVLRDSSRKSAFIYFLVFGNKLQAKQWPGVRGWAEEQVPHIAPISRVFFTRFRSSKGTPLKSLFLRNFNLASSI